MRSTLRRLAALSALPPMLLLASGCLTSGGFPPLADVKAATEAKPVPDDAIATDPVAEAHYNADVESWGDRLSAAGGRLCRFFEAIKMPGLTGCPQPAPTVAPRQ